MTQADGESFDDALALVQAAGVQATSLPVFWDEIERAPGVFDPDPNWLAIADAFYPGAGIQIVLGIHPIDTNQDRRPADLQGRPFDDPQVIARYGALLEWALSQTPDLDLVVLSVGNEVDALLGSDAEAWAAYGRFFDAARARVHQTRPGLHVGAKATYGGLMGDSQSALQALNARADALLVTYYPLGPDFAAHPPSAVQGDVDRLLAAYPDGPVHLLETGYPSGTSCGGSPGRQADFVREVFRAWDRHAARIRSVEFTWLTDIAPATVDAYVDYYGVDDACFRDYLGTLGLREHDGSSKPAWDRLVEEAEARGW